MPNADTPEDGDFAAYLARQPAALPSPGGAPHLPNVAAPAHEVSQAPAEATRQTIVDVLVGGEEPTDEFLEELNTLENAIPLSDEELESQALQHPGEDGNPHTPE